MVDTDKLMEEATEIRQGLVPEPGNDPRGKGKGYIYGIGKTRRAGEAVSEIEGVKGDRLLLVADDITSKLNFPGKDSTILEYKQDQLHEAGFDVTTIVGSGPDSPIPDTTRIEGAVSVLEPDVIYGIGGTSVLDPLALAVGIHFARELGKFGGLRMFLGRDKLAPIVEEGIEAGLKWPEIVKEQMLAGATGEFTPYCNSTDFRWDGHPIKRLVIDQRSIASLGIFDPEYTKTASVRMRISGALDSIAHLVEPYLNAADDAKNLDVLERNCRVGISLALRGTPNLLEEKLLKDPYLGDMLGRTAYLGGIQITKTGSGTGWPHQLSFEGASELSHGEWCAIGLAAYIAGFGDSRPERLRYIGSLLQPYGIGENIDLKAKEGAELGIAVGGMFLELQRSLNYPVSIAEANKMFGVDISEEHIVGRFVEAAKDPANASKFEGVGYKIGEPETLRAAEQWTRAVFHGDFKLAPQYHPGK